MKQKLEEILENIEISGDSGEWTFKNGINLISLDGNYKTQMLMEESYLTFIGYDGSSGFMIFQIDIDSREVTLYSDLVVPSILLNNNVVIDDREVIYSNVNSKTRTHVACPYGLGLSRNSIKNVNTIDYDQCSGIYFNVNKNESLWWVVQGFHYNESKENETDPQFLDFYFMDAGKNYRRLVLSVSEDLFESHVDIKAPNVFTTFELRLVQQEITEQDLQLIETQQMLTEQELENIETQQLLTEMDLERLEGGQAV